MARSDRRVELLQGTLDMLILKTLIFGPAHGHGITKYIAQTTGDVLRVEHGSLYPALHRLERAGYIASRWQKGAGSAREHRYYRLTAAGRRQLATQESTWDTLVRAIGSVMRPAADGAGS